MDNTNTTHKKKKITPFGIIFTLIAIIFIGLFVTSFFVVDETEQAVITRFGKYYKTLGPGLQLKLPFGIDRCYTVPTKIIQTEQFGFKTLKEGQNSKYLNRMGVINWRPFCLNQIRVKYGLNACW